MVAYRGIVGCIAVVCEYCCLSPHQSTLSSVGYIFLLHSLTHVVTPLDRAGSGLDEDHQSGIVQASLKCSATPSRPLSSRRILASPGTFFALCVKRCSSDTSLCLERLKYSSVSGQLCQCWNACHIFRVSLVVFFLAPGDCPQCYVFFDNDSWHVGTYHAISLVEAKYECYWHSCCRGMGNKSTCIARL
jgi:hypothetical protein